jgi:hypothetical protein
MPYIAAAACLAAIIVAFRLSPMYNELGKEG